MSSSKRRSWSISTLNLYEQCPFKYKAIKIDKREEPPSIHLTKGIAAHTKAEKFLLGVVDEVPSVCKKFTTEMHILRKRGATAEEKFVLNSNWENLNGEWLHPDAWLRCKTDARVDNIIIDFKTGKHYESHEHQARLYANVYMLLEPTVDEVYVEFWYFNSGDIKPYEYTRNMLELDINGWNTRVSALMEDQELKPRKNEYCKYCFIKNECPAWVQKPK